LKIEKIQKIKIVSLKPKINFITLVVTVLKKFVAFYKQGFGWPTKGNQEGNEEYCIFEFEDKFQPVPYRRKIF
jgi:predicted enzyme related to lactoylglutathione lyase